MFRAIVMFCLLALTPYLAHAMTDEQKTQIHEHFEKIGKICIKDNMISAEDITNLRTRKVPTGPNSPCFLACVMKQVGVLDDEGFVQKETALDLAREVFKDEEELANIKDFLHSCSNVNSEAVSDGAKGCERAMIAFKCMRENAAQFDLDI